MASSIGLISAVLVAPTSGMHNYQVMSIIPGSWREPNQDPRAACRRHRPPTHDARRAIVTHEQARPAPREPGLDATQRALVTLLCEPLQALFSEPRLGAIRVLFDDFIEHLFGCIPIG